MKLLSFIGHDETLVSSVTDETKQAMKESDENTSFIKAKKILLAMEIEGWLARQPYLGNTRWDLVTLF
jgi:hypothetical protein